MTSKGDSEMRFYQRSRGAATMEGGPSFRTLLPVACCTALLTTPALALDHGHTPELSLYVSGASAQDNALELLFRKLCIIDPQKSPVAEASNTLHVYRQGNNQRAMVCRVDGEASGLGRDMVVAFFKSSVGGSGNGPIPVANGDGRLADGQPSRFIDLAKVSMPGVCEPPRLREKGVGGQFREYFERICSDEVLSDGGIVPDAGIADVEPRLLGATPQQLEVLHVTSQNAVIFGVPVTKGLRDALQLAQGLKVGAEDEANMPSLSRLQLANLFNGNLSRWEMLRDRRGHSLVSLPGARGPKDLRVFLCRRVETSGTEAAFEVYFLGQRCSGLSSRIPAGNDGGEVGANTVNEGSGTGDVKDCLNLHEFAGRWAVGMFSTENPSNLQQDDPGPPPAKPKDRRDDRWRFIRIDRAAPTLLNVVEGRYDFFMEQTIMYRRTQGLLGGEPLAGDKLSLIDKIATNAGDPLIIRELNRKFRHTWGDAGVLALTTNGYRPADPPRDAGAVAATPVATSSKSIGGVTNNCAMPPQIVFDQPL
jgi:hypothetical protein